MDGVEIVPRAILQGSRRIDDDIDVDEQRLPILGFVQIGYIGGKPVETGKQTLPGTLRSAKAGHRVTRGIERVRNRLTDETVGAENKNPRSMPLNHDREHHGG